MLQTYEQQLTSDQEWALAEGSMHFSVPKLIELKLASGMTNPRRVRDLADVQELIETLRLPAEFSEQLHESVRDEFRQLWTVVHEFPS